MIQHSQPFQIVGKIDCSSYVSYVLWASGIKIGNHDSKWYTAKKFLTDSACQNYKWTIITNASDLQPGDIFTRNGHVEFYR